MEKLPTLSNTAQLSIMRLVKVRGCAAGGRWQEGGSGAGQVLADTPRYPCHVEPLSAELPALFRMHQSGMPIAVQHWSST